MTMSSLPDSQIDPVGHCSWEVRSIGPVRPAPTQVYSTHFGMCIGTSGMTCDAYHEAGPVIPRSSLASGSVVVE